MKKKAIVTGANGFIGVHLVKELVQSGYEVTAVIKKGTPVEDVIMPGVIICICDLAEQGALPAKLNQTDFDCFYHLAWIGSAGAMRGDYVLQLDNVRYSCDVVYAAARLGCNRFVGAGSIMEDESNQYIPENDSQPSINYIYSTAKLTAHYMAKTAANTLGIEFCWGKISNAYGIGDNTGRFINTLVKSLLAGKDCDLTPATQLYDFLYVSEVARAFRLIGEKGVSGRKYYIGSMEPAPLREFIELARDSINPRVKLNFGAIDFNGFALTDSFFDGTPLHQDTGFENAINFKDGIARYAQWLKTQESI